MTDSAGHLEKNGDGTYYPGDRVTVTWHVNDVPVAIPASEHFSISATYSIPYPLVVVDQAADRWTFASLNDTSTFGDLPITITIRGIADGSGGVLFTYSQSFDYRLVPLDPQYNLYIYPVLKDGAHSTWQDRTGVAIDYLGSKNRDGTISPNRRLSIQDHYRVNATIVNFTYSNITVPAVPGLPENPPKGKIPTGLDYDMVPDALKAEKKGDSDSIYFDGAGMRTYYLTTTPWHLNATEIDHAQNVNMTATFSWPEKVYQNRTTYTQPTPLAHGSNHLRVSILAGDSPAAVRFNVTTSVPPLNVLDKSMQDSVVYATLQQYGYDKALDDTSDPKIAKVVEGDMPSQYVGSTVQVKADGTPAIINATRMALMVPSWYTVFQTADQSRPMVQPGHVTYDQMVESSTFNGTYSNSMSPLLVIATDSNGTTYSKLYSSYDFSEESADLVMDVRQNVPMVEVSKPQDGTFGSVRAPWTIVSLQYSNNTAPINAKSCSGDTCMLDVEPGNWNETRVTAVNEFGGTSVGILPAQQKLIVNGIPFYDGQLTGLRNAVLTALALLLSLFLVRHAFRLIGRPIF